jgi:hypothetical protein
MQLQENEMKKENKNKIHRACSLTINKMSPQRACLSTHAHTQTHDIKIILEISLTKQSDYVETGSNLF